MLKLKLQYFGHLIRRASSLEKTLMLRNIESKRKRGQQRMNWINSIPDSMYINLSKLQEIVEEREAWEELLALFPPTPAPFALQNKCIVLRWVNSRTDSEAKCSESKAKVD